MYVSIRRSGASESPMIVIDVIETPVSGQKDTFLGYSHITAQITVSLIRVGFPLGGALGEVYILSSF